MDPVLLDGIGRETLGDRPTAVARNMEKSPQLFCAIALAQCVIESAHRPIPGLCWGTLAI
jgi:hypothetical protein